MVMLIVMGLIASGVNPLKFSKNQKKKDKKKQKSKMSW